MIAKLIKKRCDRCGHTVMTRKRRRCYQPRFGKGSYACWGKLVPVPPPVRAPKPEPDATDRRRLAVYAKLTAASKKIDAWQKRIERDERILGKWQRAHERAMRALVKLDAERPVRAITLLDDESHGAVKPA